MYNVLLTRRALNDLDALQKQDRVRIIKKLKEYSTAPLKYALKLEKPKMGTYRLRVGDYRIIFDIDGENMVILRIGLRKSIYR